MVGDNAYYAYPLDDPTPTNQSSARDLSGSNRTGTYQNTAAHSSASACFRDGGGSTTFDGASDYVSTPTTQNNPQTFTLETWFRTSTSSGALMGFSNSLLALIPTNWDRMVYFTTSGRLSFGVYPGSYSVITSTNGYADGNWHHMMATLGPAGQFLYVDGVQVASSTNTAAQAYNANLRFAYTYLSGWPGVVGSNYYFNGQLGHAAYYTTQLTAAAAAIHYASGRPPS
nr:LamG domain-containing protein [Microlunatus antarcticus]